MRKISFLIVPLLIGGCQAPLTSTQAVAPSSTVVASVGATPAAATDDVICRSMKVTGTRFAKRECKTLDAWKQYDTYTEQNAKESTNKLQRLNSGCATQSEGTC